MSDSSHILKEYLLSLGFRTDGVSEKRFTKTLKDTDITVGRLGKGLLGVAAAAAGMVTAFSNSMEKAYYASKLGQSTIGNMKAAAFAGKQIGLTSDQVQASITSMAMALRQNPGTLALLESLGVKVEGRDMSDVMSDMVKELRKMPFFLGSQFAEQFGMDPQTFFLMAEGLEKYNAALEHRKDLAKQTGVNEDAAAAAAMRYKQATRELTEKLTLLGERLSITLLPLFEKLSEGANSVVDKLIQTFKKYDTIEKVWNAPFPKDPRLGNWLAEQWAQLRDSMIPANKRQWRPGQAGGGRGFINPTSQPEAGNGSEFSNLNSLESKYGLPKGILDYVWWTESRRGKKLLSPKGAAGDMGFMPGTAAEWGVDVNDRQSSFNGAARYLQYLLKHYDGDVTKTLAAYNWGMGNVDSDPTMRRAPAETRNYVNGWNGAQIGGPQTTIVIQGATSPQETAAEVGRVLDQRDADYARNLGNLVLQ